MARKFFLVNKNCYMLTDSRFYGETNILKKNLSKDNIESKFSEKKGHKTVTDYRGYRVLSSFEVVHVLNSKWLIVAKIDEDEILTEYYKKNKAKLQLQIIEAFKKQSNILCGGIAIDGKLMKSVYSVVIYLNEKFKGGATRLRFDIPVDIKPKVGRCLVLNQNMEHMGCEVGEGECKYILRTDLLDDISF